MASSIVSPPSHTTMYLLMSSVVIFLTLLLKATLHAFTSLRNLTCLNRFLLVLVSLLCFVVRSTDLSCFSLNEHAATRVLFDDGVFDLLTWHQDGLNADVVVPPQIGVIALLSSLFIRLCAPLVPLFKEMFCVSRGASPEVR